MKINVVVPHAAASKAESGFSLIEVAMAIGIISFAFLSILGLVPMGMTAFRASSDRSVGTWITQQVVNEVQQSDFSTLVSTSGTSTGQQPVRYYDVDGRQLTSSNNTAPQGTLYRVNVLVSQNGVTLPGAGSANPNLATVTVQIANNPGNQQMQTTGTNTNLWSTTPGVSMMTYSAVISGYLGSNSGS